MLHSAERYTEVTPVSAARAARRALVMSALVCRGSIEGGAGHSEAESLYSNVLSWLARLKLEADLEPFECEVLNRPLGTLDSTQVIRATWAVEGLAVLAWALNHLDFPEYDDKVDPYTVTESLCFLSEGAAELVQSARLRTTAELEAYRELMYAIHCRLRDFDRDKQRKPFATWIDKTWMKILGIDVDHLIVDGDLAVDGKAIGDVHEDRLRSFEWVIGERHRASIWLLGEYPVYSETPVDT